MADRRRAGAGTRRQQLCSIETVRNCATTRPAQSKILWRVFGAAGGLRPATRLAREMAGAAGPGFDRPSREHVLSVRYLHVRRQHPGANLHDQMVVTVVALRTIGLLRGCHDAAELA